MRRRTRARGRDVVPGRPALRRRRGRGRRRLPGHRPRRGARPGGHPGRRQHLRGPDADRPRADGDRDAREEEGRQEEAPVRRGGTYVEVYNNSGISGLAGSTAARAQGAGWQVVGSDNWYGTIAASTVYFPARLEDQAQLLGKDLGIKRLKPAIAPMRGDRLTVILTSDYS